MTVLDLDTASRNREEDTGHSRDRKFVLNVGAGLDRRGDVRVDLYRAPGITALCDVLAGLPFRDNAFDEVYSGNLLEHLGNPLDGLREMARVCKPGGQITLVTDNAAFLPFYFAGHARGMHSEGGYRGRGPKDLHYGIFTSAHLRNLAAEAGVVVQSIEHIKGYDPGPIGRILTRLLSLVTLTPCMKFPKIRVSCMKQVASR